MKRYKRGDYAFEEKDGQTIIINHLTGKIISLNRTASAIWNLLKTWKSMKDINQKIDHDYIDYSQDDISQTIKALLKEKLIILDQSAR